MTEAQHCGPFQETNGGRIGNGRRSLRDLQVACLLGTLGVLVANGAVALEPRLLDEGQRRDGWIQLFDGDTLYGWTATSDANWTVSDGAIRVSSGPAGFLRHHSEFGDYALHLEFQAGPETNSGVFVRSVPLPTDPAEDCQEVNIAPPENPFPLGSVVAHAKAGAIPVNAGAWRSLDVRVEGSTTAVQVDGVETVRYDDGGARRRGHVLLQFNQGPIAFRGIRLQPLGLRPLISDNKLSQWKQYEELEGRFTLGAHGTLQVRGGPGQLETREQFADFILQLECRTNAPGLNSGVFFRCIPGDRLMGYESQIHNGFRGDRAHPVEAGTGAIFRRCPARWVVGDDLTWVQKTITVNGPQMAVWVNGYPVSDWTDARPAHENPRQGKRLAAGSIMIQAHDPTTSVDFRNLRIAELP